MTGALVRSAQSLPRLTIDQAHNVEPKVEAMVISVMNIQQAYAKALLVDHGALAASQPEGDVLAGHRILMQEFETDVHPVCAKVRADKGAAIGPVRALRDSRYIERAAEGRA